MVIERFFKMNTSINNEEKNRIANINLYLTVWMGKNWYSRHMCISVLGLKTELEANEYGVVIFR